MVHLAVNTRELSHTAAYIFVESIRSFKAKFHYAILVANRPEAGRRPVADLLARASSLL